MVTRHKNYQELREDLEKNGIQPVSIGYLQKTAEKLTGVPEPVQTTDQIVGIVEYRDGTVLDVIRKVEAE